MGRKFNKPSKDANHKEILTKTNNMYLIGLDCSINENNGFVVYRYEKLQKEFLCVRTLSFESVIGEVKEFVEGNCQRTEDGKGWLNIAVVAENAELDSGVFGAWEMFKKKIQAQYRAKFPNYKYLGTEFNKAMAMAQSIGKQKASARIIISALKQFGLEVIEIAPSWRDRSDKKKMRGGLTTTDVRFFTMPTKTNAAQFKLLTGYSERCSEHARDAATLVWNKTLEQLRVWSKSMLLQSNSYAVKKQRLKAVKAMTKPKKK